MNKAVHYCDEGQQGDIHILCTDTWDEVAWNQPELPAKVYALSSGEWFTHHPFMATCIPCLEAIFRRGESE